MGNAIPIVSIVSGATVAILVPLITAITQSGEKQREHQRERSAALREALVKCCFDLAEVATAAVNAARRVGILWGVETGPPEANDPETSFRLFRERLLGAYRTSLVLVLEVGPDSQVFKIFREGIETLNALQRPLLEARTSPMKDDVEDTIEQGLRDFFEAEAKFWRASSQLLVERGEQDERILMSMRKRVRGGSQHS